MRRRSLTFSSIGYLLTLVLLVGCVNSIDLDLKGTVDVVVVDGTITNLAEPQLIYLNRSKADPFTGRFGTTTLTKANVEVIVDASVVYKLEETDPGRYQLPATFQGQVGHSYQLRFQLADNTRYESTIQVMQSVPSIQKLTAKFNAQSLPPSKDGFTAAHDFYVDFNDPAGTRNFYRWDWKLWERQEWCRSCIQGLYSIYNVIVYGLGDYRSGDKLYEDCFSPKELQVGQYGGYSPYYEYDYKCRTRCWEIIQNYNLNLFDDMYSNGGLITNRLIAQIPFYQHDGALVDIRQIALTEDAYRYFKLVQQQTQQTGGIADTPATVPIGNVRNVANPRENVVGYFTATGVASIRYWLDRKDAEGAPPGLFNALNGREATPEPRIPFFNISGGPPRPPTAVCVPSDSRTPIQPQGWRE